MTTNPTCTECGEGRLTPSTWEMDVRHGDRTLRVKDLECYVCDHCGADPVFTDQIRRNQLRVADAKRQSDGLLTGAEVRSLREHLGLSQQQAAVIFGGGANAFSKYERGDVSQSVAMDRLLKAAAFVPGVLEFLAVESGFSCERKPLAASAYQASETKAHVALDMQSGAYRSRSVKGDSVETLRTAWVKAEAA